MREEKVFFKMYENIAVHCVWLISSELDQGYYGVYDIHCNFSFCN